jgi:hypothetical protein
MTGRGTLKILARNKDGFPIGVARVPDSNLRGSIAPLPCQQDDIGILEKHK